MFRSRRSGSAVRLKGPVSIGASRQASGLLPSRRRSRPPAIRSGRNDPKHGLIEFNGLSVLDQDLGDRAGDPRGNISEDLHGLDDTDGAVRLDDGADRYKRSDIRGARGIVGADHGALDDDRLRATRRFGGSLRSSGKRRGGRSARQGTRVHSGRRDRLHGCHVNWGYGLGAAPLEPDLHMTVIDVQVSQIIALHKADEIVDFLNVQWITGIAGFLCHAFTPLHGNRLTRVLVYREPASGGSSRAIDRRTIRV